MDSGEPIRMDKGEIERSCQAELAALARCEQMIAPLRERAVLAEAVCELLLEYMDTSIKLKEALKRWDLKRPLG